eukprot:gene23550-9780_t
MMAMEKKLLDLCKARGQDVDKSLSKTNSQPKSPIFLNDDLTTPYRSISAAETVSNKYAGMPSKGGDDRIMWDYLPFWCWVLLALLWPMAVIICIYKLAQ